MRNTLALLIVSILFFNCVNKKPNLSEEDYKKKQIEYEALKEKLSGDKAEFFNKNKNALMKKISLFKKLKDTTTVFSNVNKDSLFFLKDTSLKAVNFRLGRSMKSEKIIFLPKRDNISEYYSFNEAYDQLYSCEENTAESCEHMKTAVLKEFLDLKYAFVVEGFTIREPSIDKKNSFSSGLFYGLVLVYDLVNNKPIYKYNFVAANSEEIEYTDQKFYKNKPIDVIKRDFKSNVLSSLRKQTKKHFNFWECNLNPVC